MTPTAPDNPVTAYDLPDELPPLPPVPDDPPPVSDSVEWAQMFASAPTKTASGPAPQTQRVWEEPIPFDLHVKAPFPLDALPEPFRAYVSAVSESVQTPVNMAGCAALAVMAAAEQGKFLIRGKPDWTEPVNLYLTVVAQSSERKSAVLSHMLRPLMQYEKDYNRVHAAEVEAGRMRRRSLEQKQKALEEQFAKGKATEQDLARIAGEIASFRAPKPLRLFADDVTPEKLVSILAENDGRIALLSSEAGIFDTLAGTYSKNVNIDVMLKSYSGDPIRVDRVGRAAETVMSPALTACLMAQPNVISSLLSNPTFRGRGLTARFLYSMPDSAVGTRDYDSPAIPPEIYVAYAQQVYDLLKDEYPPEPEIITLSDDAKAVLATFSRWLEPNLKGDYADMADWAGKLIGGTLRIAGLLCRASVTRKGSREGGPLVVSAETMGAAVDLGNYFLDHARNVYNLLPEDAAIRKAQTILKMIKEKGLTEFNRRSIIRYSRAFKKVGDVQPALDFLEDHWYIRSEGNNMSGNSQRLPMYSVNPLVFE